MQNREHERGQQYCEIEALARLHDATPMLIVQGTEGGRTKEKKLLGPVPVLTGASDTPGWLHEWDSNPKYLGYWVKKKDAINKGFYDLGHPDMEPPTPTQTQLEESAKARQRAESTSTQPSKHRSPISSDDDPVDKDPVRTERLAAILEGNPIFQDIAEAVG